MNTHNTALIAGIITALIAAAILGVVMDDRTVGVISGIAIGTIMWIAMRYEVDGRFRG